MMFVPRGLAREAFFVPTLLPAASSIRLLKMIFGPSMHHPFTLVLSIALAMTSLLPQIGLAETEDTFSPYESDEDVPKSALAVWETYDASAEPLDIEVIKEWDTEGITTRYITFTVGTFKGQEARIAAYYSFPKDKEELPAFVWCHGGGQSAERGRGVYFARQGFATVDINWLGRPLEQDIDINTDWGRVDPSQGPQFYAKALRRGWKRNLQPDEYSIDPVASPRNANWFLLVVAARRAITFLETQPEVDPSRIGMSGYSMGGMITALSAIDPRLKAVAPFVGGIGFKYVDFPGVEGSSIRPHFQNLELYQSTIDASAYWPHIQCPVVFISSTNDFHSTFERIYQSLDLLPHQNWRITTNLHQNHGPGPEQWVFLNLWFSQYLKGITQPIPKTPISQLEIESDTATMTVMPEDQDRLLDTELYYSHDPNSRTRFWIKAEAKQIGNAWSAQLPKPEGLPLYTFALCRYRLPKPQTLERGSTDTVVVNSREHVWMPEELDLTRLKTLARPDRVFEDFKNGFQDWSSRDQRTITTYKFQNPKLDRANTKRLAITLDPQDKRLVLRLKTSSKFLDRRSNQGDFSCQKVFSTGGPQTWIIDRQDFVGPEGVTIEWDKVATFTLSLVDPEARQTLPLMTEQGQSYLKKIEMINP